MKRVSMVFLQLVIAALGIGVLAALLWEPHIEGVNASATTLREIYFDDPFLAYIYFSFIPVFMGFYHAFRFVGNIGRGETYAAHSVQALRSVRYCAMTFAGLIFAAVVHIVIVVRGKDDIAGGVAVGLFLVVSSMVVAVIAAMSERRLRKGSKVS